MREFLIVGGGSFLGGVGRYYLSSWVLHTFATSRFPLGTFIVNFFGCLLIGLIAGIAEHQHLLSNNSRLFLITGLLGGFTTFSAFGHETIFLFRAHDIDLAVLNIGLSIIGCLGAVWLGTKLAH